MRPIVTAGLKWPPEMCPTAYAIVSTVSPKASDTPRRPMPRLESGPPNAAASTALPQPPNTSQNVPKASAAIFLVIVRPSGLVSGTRRHLQVDVAGAIVGIELERARPLLARLGGAAGLPQRDAVVHVRRHELRRRLDEAFVLVERFVEVSGVAQRVREPRADVRERRAHAQRLAILLDRLRRQVHRDVRVAELAVQVRDLAARERVELVEAAGVGPAARAFVDLARALVVACLVEADRQVERGLCVVR